MWLEGLLVPRLTADMINIGVESGNIDYMIGKGIAMLAVAPPPFSPAREH